MLDDPVGSSLALNRIAVAYYKRRKIGKSLKFHIKHSEYTDKENAFAAYYNIGICNRILGQYAKAIESFSRALEWSLYRDVIFYSYKVILRTLRAHAFAMDK